MAIGERIRFFRNLRGMTQKYLGQAVGFPDRTADIRTAQYESGTRTPKADLTAELAKVLEVSPQALSVPDIDSYIGLMHTLFTLEDVYGLTVSEADGEVCLKLKASDAASVKELRAMLNAWREQAAKFEAGEIDNNYVRLLEYDIESICYFDLWLKKKFADTEQNGSIRKELIEIIGNLIRSNDLRVKYAGLNYAEQHKLSELASLIKKQLKHKAAPPKWFSENGLYSYGWTIAERARKALKNI